MREPQLATLPVVWVLGVRAAATIPRIKAAVRFEVVSRAVRHAHYDSDNRTYRRDFCAFAKRRRDAAVHILHAYNRHNRITIDVYI